MAFKSFISGCHGLSLTTEERTFFASEKPVGLILFARNCENKDQIRQLIDSFRDAVDDERALVLIDQEGGRVQRLKPPHWRSYPTGRRLGQLLQDDVEAGKEAILLLIQLLASELHELGINVDCLPVLDIPISGADDVIGDRAYGTDIDLVSNAGRIVCDALMQGGVLPVIKHIPGHGRALCDSHKDLPVVSDACEILESTDFAPFKSLRDMPLAMSAHIVFQAYDADEPASTSPRIIQEVIRNMIGFDGVLMCDDLSMQALSGPMIERTKRVLSAGCDLALHCNGVFDEMVEVAKGAEVLEGEGLRRVNDAFSLLKPPQEFDVERAEQLRLSLLSA